MAMCGCGRSWSGLRTCHCAKDGCHRTFSGITAFDAHRPGKCLDPGECGMVVVRTSEDIEVWGHPSTGDDQWWKKRGTNDV